MARPTMASGCSYTDESQPCDLFASDDRGITNELPQLTVNYVQDTTTPGGAITAINGGSSPTPTIPTSPSLRRLRILARSPSGAATGATRMGIGANGGTAAHWVTNGAQLAADTSSCGATACAAQTFIPSNASTWSNVANWPTFTAMFKSDLGGQFNFGMVASGNNNTRFDLVAAAGILGLHQLWSIRPRQAPSPRWQSIFPSRRIPGTMDRSTSRAASRRNLSLAGWADQTSRTDHIRNGVYMSQPGLNFWEQGDNSGSGSPYLHHRQCHRDRQGYE